MTSDKLTHEDLHRFTVDQLKRLGDLVPERAELLDGLIMTKPSLGLDGLHRFTVKDFHRMMELGVLGEDDRVELTEGLVVKMAPIGRRHAASTKRLNAIFTVRLAGRAIVSVQDPIQLLDFSEEYPDLALLRPRGDFYLTAIPGPGDVLLVVEVADTSVRRDRDIKLPLYGRAGIAETWVMDLPGQTMLVGRGPTATTPTGYQSLVSYHRGQTQAPVAFPDLVLEIEELLGPAPLRSGSLGR